MSPVQLFVVWDGGGLSKSRGCGMGFGNEKLGGKLTATRKFRWL